MLGAGIAGLVAAYELERLGYAVEILEAGSRLGGRIHTHRFGSGSQVPYVELGAMRVPAEHHHTLHYIDELGLTGRLRRFETLLSNEENYLATGMGHLRRRDASPVIIEEFQKKFADHRYSDSTILFGAWLSTLANAISPTVFRANLDDAINHELLGLIEGIDLTPYLRGGTDVRVDLHTFFSDHTHLRNGSSGRLARFLHDIINETSPELVRLEGGMDQMVHRLANRIRGPIKFGQEVIDIDLREDHALLHVREGGHVIVHRRDRVLCTLPFSVLRRFRLPGFSTEKKRIISEITYWSATKVAVHCREAFWEGEGITGGASFGGGRIRQMFYPPKGENTPAGAVLLASYTMGGDADVLGRMPIEERHTVVLEEAAAIHPQLRTPGMVRGVVSAVWGQDPLSQGAGVTRWGKDTRECERERQLASAPEGCVHFAGEHCSSTPAWVDGAIESAVHAVRTLSGHTVGVTPATSGLREGMR
ncbi:FAD-dependent oxidoreductase (plasmid) [Nocardiopsis flavescens]|uniref:LooO n=1 Tax=Nocardiopsis flavescens TaxID=758803 RepID=A0A6M5K873_9ACTN|nr:LooO [Nocardiopsis flavescens]QKW32436.1 FAD-dependent oxidoreductase [Nocardiopsis flavescens]